MTLEAAKYIPWIAGLAAALCSLCCTARRLRPLAAPVSILALLAGFAITLGATQHITPGSPAQTLKLFDWIHIGSFHADMSYYLDPLTIVMLLVVTGIGSLVAIYAAGYMAGDRGYARFFAGVSLFIFAMTSLVMADNLALLYLGWEGVGLCSYLLIGFYYHKPAAVAAAKKAFIVNRIGDLGFALGVFLAYHQFGTVAYTGLLEHAHALTHAGHPVPFPVLLIPFLLMLGAFGKSAQLPLYVWLPDAMEGPTPVSALIHAATMVTAGVYMIARLFPLFELSPYALPTVAIIGAATALFAALIALRQFDIKRVFAYSTISQLGYMFLGVGAASTVGGMFHLVTHAFFKALLFLTAGSVMHAMAGQLDLRKMSGLRTKMPLTASLMFIGCLALAGFPFTAGFFSKDAILATALQRGLDTPGDPLYLALAAVGLLTALLTAYYTFRLWFRLFMGPTTYEMGTEHASHDRAHPPRSHDIHVEHHHEPHEVGWLMNAPLLVLAAGALFAGWLGEHWTEQMIQASTAASEAHPAHAASLGGFDLHRATMLISSTLALLGIAVAAYYHWINRPAADSLARRWQPLATVLQNKFYVDEFCDAAIVKPLRLIGELCFVFDRLIVEGLVASVGYVPRLLGWSIQPIQSGSMQGYGLGMAAGAAALVLFVLILLGS
jgi:NADH-quinone oxidoreductase subunit L